MVDVRYKRSADLERTEPEPVAARFRGAKERSCLQLPYDPKDE
jgi:hypothetical protein